MTISIEFTPGLPPPLAGSCVFLMGDGMLCEGEVIVRDGRRLLVHYDLTAPRSPQRIEHPADGGKVQAYARIADRGRAAART